MRCIHIYIYMQYHILTIYIYIYMYTITHDYIHMWSRCRASCPKLPPQPKASSRPQRRLGLQLGHDGHEDREDREVGRRTPRTSQVRILGFSFFFFFKKKQKKEEETTRDAFARPETRVTREHGFKRTARKKGMASWLRCQKWDGPADVTCIEVSEKRGSSFRGSTMRNRFQSSSQALQPQCPWNLNLFAG